MNKKTILGIILLVVLACLLFLMFQKLTFEKNIKVVLEDIHTTSHDDYPDHWDIYRQKRIDFEAYYSKDALEDYSFDHIITDAMSTYYHYGSNSVVDKIKFNFTDVFNMKKISCSFTVYVDLEYVTTDREPDQIEVYGEASLVKEDEEWKVNYIRRTGSNYYDVRLNIR